MALPALIYLALAKILSGPVSAWGVPMATDLPIALAVLIIFGKGLPIALRGFLLTLAIMDDVGSILVIAFRFTQSLEFTWLLGALLALFIFYHSTRNFIARCALILSSATSLVLHLQIRNSSSGLWRCARDGDAWFA